MGETSLKVAGRATVIQARKPWPVRRGLLGVGAVAALATLAACSASAATPARQATSAVALGTQAANRSVQGVGAPEMVSSAIASGKTRQPTATATPKKTEQEKQPSATASATDATTGATAATPSATPTGTVTSGENGADPSGQNPAADLAGFTLRYVQEFNADSAPAHWNLYDAVPGGESGTVAQWEPSMCTFSGGEAHFMASGIDSCGMKYLGANQEYGAWFARLQAGDQPSGEYFSDIFLLWPANYQWPPEIDVYEDRGGRSRTYASLIDTVGDICGSSPTWTCLAPYTQSNGPDGGVANTDTEWHTYGVEWTPSGVSWLIDGSVIFTAPSDQAKSPAYQPDLAMNMALQSQNLQDTTGTPSLRDTMNVDWVEQFGWNG